MAENEKNENGEEAGNEDFEKNHAELLYLEMIPTYLPTMFVYLCEFFSHVGRYMP